MVARRANNTKRQAPAKQEQKPPTHAAMREATFAALRQMLSERPFGVVAPIFNEMSRAVANGGGKITAQDGSEVDVDLLAIPLSLWEQISTLLAQSESAPTFAVVRSTVSLVAASPAQQ